MADWNMLAEDSWSAARELFDADRWRSAVSRAYYASFSRATATLHEQGLTPPADREGWGHRQLPDLLAVHLNRLGSRQRWELFGLLTTLYNLRLMADYIPAADVGEHEARTALGLMHPIARLLQEGRHVGDAQ